MYKLVIEYEDDDLLLDIDRSAMTFDISTKLVEYEAYGCCVDSRTIMFNDDSQRTIALLVVCDFPGVRRLKLG